MRKLVPLIALALALTACGVPHQRGDLAPGKDAARDSEIDQVFTRYREVRSAAISLLDAKPLSTVETGPMLAIDSGSFEVSQRFARKQEQDAPRQDVIEVLTPRFTKYPLWFCAVVRDRDTGLNRVQIFERASAVDPWLLVASPQTLAETALPALRRGSGGAVLMVEPDNGAGMSMSAQQAADAYAKVLADPSAPEADEIADDSFIRQMRATAEQNASLAEVSFSQAWDAEDVTHVLRTSDGGALAFVTLQRRDAYKVKEGLTVTWPEGTPQRAFLSEGISGSGTLRYYHQVLLYLPGGDGKPRAIGQYGGVVGADTG